MSTIVGSLLADISLSQMEPCVGVDKSIPIFHLSARTSCKLGVKSVGIWEGREMPRICLEA